MSAETRDVEALAGLLYECHSDASDAPWESIKRLGLDAVYQRQARRLLASDWLVEHVARHVNEALESAAQRVEAAFDATEWNDWSGQMRLERRILKTVREGIDTEAGL